MQQIKIKEDALPILKAGIALQKKLIGIKLENYFRRLKNFEKKYNMESDVFIKEFEIGNLGDDEDWFDWLFVYKAYKEIIVKKNIIESLSL